MVSSKTAKPHIGIAQVRNTDMLINCFKGRCYGHTRSTQVLLTHPAHWALSEGCSSEQSLPEQAERQPSRSISGTQLGYLSKVLNSVASKAHAHEYIQHAMYVRFGFLRTYTKMGTHRARQQR